MIKVNLLTFWLDKEKAENRRIPLKEVAEATGLAPETIRKLRDNQTKRFDEPVIVALCQYFGVASGQPVPFLEFVEED